MLDRTGALRSRLASGPWRDRSAKGFSYCLSRWGADHSEHFPFSATPGKPIKWDIPRRCTCSIVAPPDLAAPVIVRSESNSCLRQPARISRRGVSCPWMGWTSMGLNLMAEPGGGFLGRWSVSSEAVGSTAAPWHAGWMGLYIWPVSVPRFVEPVFSSSFLPSDDSLFSSDITNGTNDLDEIHGSHEYIFFVEPVDPRYRRNAHNRGHELLCEGWLWISDRIARQGALRRRASVPAIRFQVTLAGSVVAYSSTYLVRARLSSRSSF
ncbi:hypothetical protein BDY21DRAFT_196441 [Lineolata rhizophorae]|uniref:Uncharacterized protein n=1 Tax=Lineolata rhizophorae TaxID=578093 RepID=A0A6A6P609_9PEZI|nr:hypothetical protein BDY21DRAFT_196441 [Lineolata rhizophorae]